jgi:hypothetical protein
MPRTRPFLIAGLVAATTLIAAAPADARSFVLRATGSTTGLGEVQAIGDFKPSVNPRLRAAVRAFGPPDRRRGGGEICRVRWNRFGLTIIFQNFGGFDSCGPRGLAQKAIVSATGLGALLRACASATVSPASGSSIRTPAEPHVASGSSRGSCRSAGRCPTRYSARASRRAT